MLVLVDKRSGFYSPESCEVFKASRLAVRACEFWSPFCKILVFKFIKLKLKIIQMKINLKINIFVRFNKPSIKF